MSTWVFDVETLPNRTLFRAMCVETRERFSVWRHEPDAPQRLREFVLRRPAVFVGFNSRGFDEVVTAAFVQGLDEAQIKTISNDLIENRLAPWDAYNKYKLYRLAMDSIDLIEVAPSFVSLKAYGARMHMPLLQDMPLAHDKPLAPGQEPLVEAYCDNDLLTTAELLRRLESEILLRVEMSKRYGVDMRSKSDSQMAEQAYITSMKLARRQKKIPATVRYIPPEFLSFTDTALRSLLERVSQHEFTVNQKTGHVELPDFLGEDIIAFGAGTYQLGVGGIHSTHDKSVCHVAGAHHVICDIDAASFYPSIILECGFVPAGLGQRFVDEYRKIYQQRLHAKRTGDKATDATLKISLNGTFGKLASQYSVLYAPDLMLAVTLTGQFTLLMLIERLEQVGAVTLSANTDGIAVRYALNLEPEVRRVVAEFEALSRFKFEFTQYRVLAMKDVNNYLAVKLDRTVKARGIYAPLSLRKNPTAQVCADAVGEWLANGTPLLRTIKNAPFVDFLSARNVTGGGVQCGEYLGKVVRWYQSTDKTLGPITYALNGNKVPKTEGARACMRIDPAAGHPADLDLDWYYFEALKIAQVVGCESYLSPAERARLVPPPKPTRKTKNVS